MFPTSQWCILSDIKRKHSIAADPPPYRRLKVENPPFFTFCLHLPCFYLKILLKTVQDDFRNIQNKNLSAAAHHHRRRPSPPPPLAVAPKFQRDDRYVSLWVSILGLLGPLISIMTLDFTSAASPAGQRSPAARRYTKIKEDDRYIVIGIVFWVIWIADFNNAIRFYAHRPARRQGVTRRSMVTRRPPPHQNSKKMTNISLWVTILGLFGPLISITTLDLMSADLPTG